MGFLKIKGIYLIAKRGLEKKMKVVERFGLFFILFCKGEMVAVNYRV